MSELHAKKLPALRYEVAPLGLFTIMGELFVKTGEGSRDTFAFRDGMRGYVSDDLLVRPVELQEPTATEGGLQYKVRLVKCPMGLFKYQDKLYVKSTGFRINGVHRGCIRSFATGEEMDFDMNALVEPIDILGLEGLK